MHLRRRHAKHLELDVSAFADVAFLLIIFFILTTTFVKPAGSKLQIPAGASDPSKAQKKQPTVTLAGSAIHYGDRDDALSLDELRGLLLRENLAAREPSDRIVVVNSAPDVPYELYFDVVMAIDSADGVLAIVEEDEEAER